MVYERNQNVCPRNPHGGVLVLERKLYDLQQPVADEVLVQLRPAIRLQTFGYGTALLNEQDTILLSLKTFPLSIEDTKELLQERGVRLKMLDDVDLVEEDERIQYREGRVVQDARENDVFEVLQSVCRVNLPFYLLVLDLHHLLELGLVGKVLPVVCFVQGEVGVVYNMSEIAWIRCALKLTLQSPNDTKDDIIMNHVFDDGGVVEQDKHLHDTAQAVQVRYTLKVLSHVNERYKQRNVFVGEDKLCQSLTTAGRRVGGAHVVFDFVEIAEVGRGQHNGGNVVEVIFFCVRSALWVMGESGRTLRKLL
jgi:hypothetical protein